MLIRSDAQRLSMEMPDGAHWAFQKRAGSVALLHTRSQSSVTVQFFDERELMSRDKCRTAAFARELPIESKLKSKVNWLAEEVLTGPGAYDTGLTIGVLTAQLSPGALSGTLLAVGGFLRKCFVFEFVTSIADALTVAREVRERALSERLAFARRIFATLRFDSLRVTEQADDTVFGVRPAPKS
jgi:hypothetical protein